MAPGSPRSPLLVLVAAFACGNDGGAAADEGDASTAASGDAGSTTGAGASTGGSPTTTAGAATSAADSGGATASSTAAGDTAGATTGPSCGDEHRVIAYLANWTDCPTAEQLAQYTHVVIAFGVSYVWSPDGPICTDDCSLQPVEACSGSTLDELVATLHAQGIEVLVSFGGASMGGLWEGTCGQMTKCWDACIDRADQLAAALTTVVVEADLDGVDIDYEYCTNDAAYTGFLVDLTTELRASLDAAFPDEHKLLTHVPMDSEVEQGDAYFGVLEQVADDVDFVMPQYYNGGRSPFTPEGLTSIHEHYDALVAGPFGGDASRVVFGYCIEPGCNPVATQPEALAVTEMFDAWYPDNGGIFFWAHPDDTEAWFSAPFRQHYDETACSHAGAP